MLFRSSAPRVCGEIFPDDSIFVLTGDERRIPFAMRKLNEYPNIDLYIIGAGATSIATERPAIIESQSKSTYQNALAIKKIATHSIGTPTLRRHSSASDSMPMTASVM